jgi:hypothetical protein
VAAALQDTNSTILTDLEVDNKILDLIQDDFLKMLHGDTIKVHSFQEGQGLIGIKGFDGKVPVFVARLSDLRLMNYLGR